jgi:hypothetical protein
LKLAALACFIFATGSLAQMQPHSAAKPSPAFAPPSAPSLFDRPAQPAKISLVAGRLTVEANNSSLSEILHQVSQLSGMTVDGLQSVANSNQRVFGIYGPGAARDVLSDLLHGTDYNIMMIGETASGTPRQLTLTARIGGGIPNPASQSRVIDRDDDSDNDSSQPTQYTDDQQVQTDPDQLPHSTGPGVRTPQQMLEELQRMRQQQQQSQQQQQPQQN